MHVSPVKHSSSSVTDRRTDRQTDGRTDGRTDRQTDRRTTDKVIAMCRYASQASQKGEDLKRNMTAKKYQWPYTKFACLDRSNHDKIDAGQLIIGPREYPFLKMYTHA